MKLSISLAGLLFTVSLLGQHAVPAQADSPIYVGKPGTGTVSFDQVDHAPWETLLQRYVDNDGYVNYTAWIASSTDRQALDRYLNSLSQASLNARSSHDAKLAFWINAYNAVTVHGILREYPTSSIRNHTAKLFGYNVWQDLQLYVGGKPHSLEGIEHEILRKMNEPRIHFAIVCASIGCPRLLNHAYTATDVQQQLETNAKDFFSRSQNFRYDEGNQTFSLSEILSWFAEDFGANQSAQLKTIANWLPTSSAQSAAQRGTVSVSFLEYNWNLNDQKSRSGITRR